MGLGQTLLTIMALMLFGTVILTMNRSVLDTSSSRDLAKFRIAATSFGISMMEEISSRNFDEKTTTDTSFATSSNTALLTPKVSFGAELGEDSTTASGKKHYAKFDDIDDFYGFTWGDSIGSAETGKVYLKDSVSISYVDVTSLAVSTTQTLAKQVTVFVTSDALWDYTVNPPRPDTLKFQAIYTYWFFR